VIGLVGGLLSGLLGVGGGFVMVPLLVLWAKLPQHRAIGTSLLAIIPIAIVGALIYYFQGGDRPQVDLGFALLLVIGSVIGAYLGARAMNRVPEAQLKIAIAVLLAVVGLKELVFP
jgi:uncharacterized protein